MPEIRPYLSSEGFTTPDGGDRASASAFDSSQGVEAVGRGLSASANTLGYIAARQAEEKKRLKEEQDTVWVGESIEKEKVHWLEWMSSPDNVQNPNVAQDFAAYSKQRISELAAGAPSTRAANALRLHLGPVATRTFSEALDVGRKASFSRLGQSFDLRKNLALQAYRSGGTEKDLIESLYGVFGDIDKTIAPYSTDTAERLKTGIELDAAYAAIDTNPNFAKQLVLKSTRLDEHQKSTLLAKIEQVSTHVDAEQRVMFEQSRDDARTRWAVGADFNEIPLDSYKAVYPDDVARANKRIDDEQLKIARGAFEEYKHIQDKSPFFQAKHLGNLAQAISSEAGAKQYDILRKRVDESMRLYEHDKVGWLTSNNDDVRSLTEKARSVTDAERPAILAQRADLMLRLQGRPPEGLTPNESAKYFDLPEHLKSVLTTSEAEEYASRINSGTPNQAIDTFNTLMAQFTSPHHRVVAFNDMVRLPASGKGVRQELQLVIQNRNAWWLGDYISAINQHGDVKSLSKDEYKDFEDRLTSNGKWLAFQRALIGDNLQRADELSGFRRGIITFAQSMTLRGSSVKDSVNKSIDLLLGDTLGIATVNDMPLVIPRETTKPGVSRDDAAIADLGRRLTVALSMVDPMRIDDSNINVGGQKDPVFKAQLLRDQITTRGFFQPTQDGQGVSLFLPDSLGNPVPVRDKKGRAFRIMYDELPAMMETRTIYSSSGLPIDQREMPVYPGRVYDLMSKTGSDLLGTTEYRSHWPIQPAWLRNE